MQIQTKSIDFKADSLSDQGTFSGYGSVFNVIDSWDDIVAPGAFTKSLQSLASKDRSVPILWQHDTENPIGVWSGLKEDSVGLFGDGALWLDDTPTAKLAYKGMSSRAITGLSIGYITRSADYDQKTGIRTLKELDLIEISVVTNPANDEARVTNVKSRLLDGSLTERDFENILRDAGFSRSDAVSITNHGFKSLLQRDAGARSEEIKAVFDAFSIPNL
ncbi:HK97 family phage prohead protease [Pandoraea apista]|uniref:HK97 family phage prohead protease n=1 Tax=Pandoraea apista TaxID=93218 RepID=A0ABX9ZLD4_9BURK|nr:HK97 family phage prohead protease [Pandoraea apista]RSK77863.1 HK97 family phage prohead protease [Pandoraea apista]RUN81851.1 HK97 family phage prohead protease [Pandoraea apista]